MTSKRGEKFAWAGPMMGHDKAGRLVDLHPHLAAALAGGLVFALGLLLSRFAGDEDLEAFIYLFPLPTWFISRNLGRVAGAVAVICFLALAALLAVAYGEGLTVTEFSALVILQVAALALGARERSRQTVGDRRQARPILRPAGTTSQEVPSQRFGGAALAKARVVEDKGEHCTLSLDDGGSLDVPVFDPMRDWLHAGSPAVVCFDHEGRPVGWYLPEAELGVDMRHWWP